MSPQNIRREIEPAVESFMHLGFPRYESLILAILTALGTSTVKEIHTYTDVPLPKVYQTLDSLSLKGFIKQHSKTRPVKYTAYSVAIIIRKIEENNRHLESKLKIGLEKLSDLSKPTFAGEISPFNGIDDLIRIGRGVILNAKSQLSVAGCAKTLELFSEEFKAKKDDGVQLRSMIFSQFDKINKDLAPENFKKLGFEHYEVDLPLKFSPNLKFFSIIKKLVSIVEYLGIIISDNNETLILLPLFPHESYFGIWVSSPEIVEKQIHAYNEVFKIAHKV